MESSIILKNFMLSRASLHEVITLEQFARLFPRRVSKSTIQRIFEELVEQRESKSIEPTKNKIQEQFDVPLQDTIDKLKTSQSITSGKHSIDDLVTRLDKLENIFVLQNTLIDDQIANVIHDIQSICKEFNEIKYGNAWFRGGDETEIEKIVEETIRSVDKCDSIFR